MTAGLPHQAWFATLDFHDDTFSRENVVIAVDQISGCELTPGTPAKVAAFRSQVAQTDFQAAVDRAQNPDGEPTSGAVSTDDDGEQTTTSHSTKRTSRSSKSFDGYGNGSLDPARSLVFIVSQPSAEQKGKRPNLQVSLHMSVRKQLDFSNRQQVVVLPANEEAATASFVEIAFRDQYLARADMWQLTLAELSRKAVVRGQNLLFLGTIKARVKNIFVRGQKVNSAFVASSTVPIFRSEAARYVFFIQMSQEMWDYDTEGSGEIMFSKIVNGFLPDLFKRWQRMGVRHLVSIILFTRLAYEKGVLKQLDQEGKDKHRAAGADDKDYRDFYKVVTTDMTSKDWVRILYELRKEFKVFLRDTLILSGDEAYGRKPDTLAEVKDASDIECVIAGRPTTAAKGNVLEAINLASTQFAQDYIDRDLVRTGISLVIVTAGTGVFEVDYNMLKLTTDTLVGNGIGIDLVSLSPMPLHSVPLFRYRAPIFVAPTRGSSAVGSLARADSTPRNMSLIYPKPRSPIKPETVHDVSSTPATKKSSTDRSSDEPQWEYAMPHWIDVSFWAGDVDDQPTTTRLSRLTRRQNRESGFFASCRMYELQMMGLMESEMTDIAISFIRMRPDLMDSQAAKSSADLAVILPEVASSQRRTLMVNDVQTPLSLSTSPKKTTAEQIDMDDQDAGRFLSRWMTQYDRDVAADTRWDLVTQVQIPSKHVEGAPSGELASSSRQPRDVPRNSTSPEAVKKRPDLISRPFPAATGKERTSVTALEPDGSSMHDYRTDAGKSPEKGVRRAFMPRQISLGPKGLGPLKATVSTGISSANVDTIDSMDQKKYSTASTKKPTNAPSKMSELLTQQLRNTLKRKPSQTAVLAAVKADATSAVDLVPSHPISINKESTGEASEAEPEQSATVKPNTMFKARAERPTARSSDRIGQLGNSLVSTSFKDRFGVQGGLSPLRAMSPWLTLLNPSNPRQENMSIASQYRRWQHVFPRTISTSTIKWKSLCSPAALPLTSEYFPSPEDLRDLYDENPYTVSVQSDYDTAEAPPTREALLKQLIASRLSNGFQIVIGQDAQDFSRSHGSRLIDCFEPELAVDDGATVLMSVGNNFHQLICLDDHHIEVRRFIRKPVQVAESEGLVDPTVVYHPRVRTMYAESYQKRRFMFRNPRSKYDWSTIDQFLSDREYDLSPDLRYWRARYVLIPVELPKGSRGPLAPVTEVSDEEIRLEGIQRLTQLWQRHRYVSPDERRFQASVQQRHKDPNPLAIDYQTRDPSAVSRAYASRTADTLLHGEMQQSLFAEDELYHTNDFDLQKLAQHMQAVPPKGINVVDRRWHWKLYYKCFRGDEFSTWLLTNFKDMETRDDAVKLGNELMKRGLFTHVQQKHHFRDGNYFYQIAGEYRTTPYPDAKASWFSKVSDRSMPTTPLIEGSGSRSSPFTDRAVPRPSIDDSPASSGTSTPTTKERKTLELSRMLQYDVDPRRRSWRPEIVNLHYDRIHNPENCYHLRVEWMNVTSKLIEDAVSGWAAAVERYGLKLVGLPIAEACHITERHPFRAPYRIRLAVPPPVARLRQFYDIASFGPQGYEDKFSLHRALLRKWDFVLDFEAASCFDGDVQVTYSWGVPDYRHTQFVHRSGVVVAEIDDDGSFLLLANKLASNRSSSSSHAATGSTGTGTTASTSAATTSTTAPTASTAKGAPHRPPLSTTTTTSSARSPYSSPIIRPMDDPPNLPSTPRLTPMTPRLGPRALAPLTLTTPSTPSTPTHPTTTIASTSTTTSSSNPSQTSVAEPTAQQSANLSQQQQQQPKRPKPTAESIKLAVEHFCHDTHALEEFYEEALRAASVSAAPSPRVGPVLGFGVAGAGHAAGAVGGANVGAAGAMASAMVGTGVGAVPASPRLTPLMRAFGGGARERDKQDHRGRERERDRDRERERENRDLDVPALGLPERRLAGFFGLGGVSGSGSDSVPALGLRDAGGTGTGGAVTVMDSDSNSDLEALGTDAKTVSGSGADHVAPPSVTPAPDSDTGSSRALRHGPGLGLMGQRSVSYAPGSGSGSGAIPRPSQREGQQETWKGTRLDDAGYVEGGRHEEGSGTDVAARPGLVGRRRASTHGA